MSVENNGKYENVFRIHENVDFAAANVLSDLTGGIVVEHDTTEAFDGSRATLVFSSTLHKENHRTLKAILETAAKAPIAPGYSLNAMAWDILHSSTD